MILWSVFPEGRRMDAVEVRKLVIELLPELGFEAAEPTRQTVLVQKGYYAGIRFAFKEIQAVWLIESGSVEFVQRDGKRLRSVELGAEESRKAA
jgi:hypothetical protein